VRVESLIVSDYHAPPIPPPPPAPSWPYAAPTAAPPKHVNASARRGVNTLAVTTLVVGLIPWLGASALFIGMAALKRTHVTGERGRVLALIGMTFGGLWALTGVLRALAG
jgi:hypothetical protein